MGAQLRNTGLQKPSWRSAPGCHRDREQEGHWNITATLDNNCLSLCSQERLPSGQPLPGPSLPTSASISAEVWPPFGYTCQHRFVLRREE